MRNMTDSGALEEVGLCIWIVPYRDLTEMSIVSNYCQESPSGAQVPQEIFSYKTGIYSAGQLPLPCTKASPLALILKKIRIIAPTRQY